MDNQLFREKSLARISSPEQLNDYLRVTNPAVWLVLAAVILLLVGMLIWGSTASIDSLVTGTAQVADGNMRIVFDDEQFARNVDVGMPVKVGNTETKVSSVGTDESGRIFAVAETTLSDGSYQATVTFRSIKVLRLLFN